MKRKDKNKKRAPKKERKKERIPKGKRKKNISNEIDRNANRDR